MFSEEYIHEHSANQMWLVAKLMNEPDHWSNVVEEMVEQRDMTMADALTMIFTGLQTGAIVFSEDRVGVIQTFSAPGMDSIEAEMRILLSSEKMKEIIRKRKEL